MVSTSLAQEGAPGGRRASRASQEPWKFTPLIGGARGTVQAFVPEFEASLAWGKFDFRVEAEFVRDRNEKSDSYNYAWSELGYKPLEWLRIGNDRVFVGSIGVTS